MLMLMFGGLLVAMGGKLWGVKWVIFAGLIIMFGGIFCIAAYGLLRSTRPRKSKPISTSLPEILRADTTNKLLRIANDDFIPSVVDDTTELLKIPSTRKSASRD
jgi:hypothetical protein